MDHFYLNDNIKEIFEYACRIHEGSSIFVVILLFIVIFIDLLTVINAGAKIIRISSLIAQPGKLKHLNFRFITLKALKQIIKSIFIWRELILYYIYILTTIYYLPAAHN